MGDERPHADDGAVTDGNSLQDGDILAGPYVVTDANRFRNVDQLAVLGDGMRVGAPDIDSLSKDAIFPGRNGNTVSTADNLATAERSPGPDMDRIVVPDNLDVHIVHLDMLIHDQGMALAPDEDRRIEQVRLPETDSIARPLEADARLLEDRGLRVDLILPGPLEPGPDDDSLFLEPPERVGQDSCEDDERHIQ